MTKRAPALLLDPSDLEDIRAHYVQHGATWLAEWLGCSESTIRWHARQLGLTRRCRRGPAKGAKRSLDLPGSAKVCLGCGELKPLSEFHAQSRGRMGRRSRCRPCDWLQRRERYRRNLANPPSPDPAPDLPLKTRYAVQNCVRFPSTAELEAKLWALEAPPAAEDASAGGL